METLMRWTAKTADVGEENQRTDSEPLMCGDPRLARETPLPISSVAKDVEYMPTAWRPYVKSVARGEGHLDLVIGISGAARGDDASICVSGSGQSGRHPQKNAASS